MLEFGILLLAGTLSMTSDVASDEVVVFFPTVGQPTDNGGWKLHIHGRVIEPEVGSTRRLKLETLVSGAGLDQAAEGSAIFHSRASAFLVDDERDKVVVVQIGDLKFPLTESKENGHFEDFVVLTGAQAQPLIQEGNPPRIRFHAVLDPDDSRRFEGAVQLLPATGVTVISDIDDTIKISEVRDRSKLVANTFLKPFRPVEGMKDFYSRLSQAGVAFHYVSSSPWPLYEPLAEFTRETGFPDGIFHLIPFSWADGSAFKLFEEAREKKMPAIRTLLAAWPQRRFILIGDSGESDPEIYGEVAQEHPGQVQWIIIRDITNEDRNNDRMKAAFDEVPSGRWILFRDVSELNGRSFP